MNKKQEPTITDLPANMTGRDMIRWMYAARTKGDLQDWTGCPPFHLNKEPVEDSNGRG